MTSTKIKAFIIEDEPLPLQEFIEALQESDEFDVVGSCTTNADGLTTLRKLKCDILFLDLKVSDGFTFTLLNNLKKEGIILPPIVIVSGRREFEYAQKIFNDYHSEVIYILNKPFWQNWVQHHEKILEGYFKFIQKLNQESIITQLHSDFIHINFGRKSYMIKHSDIISIKTGEKAKGITEIILLSSKINCNLSLTFILNKLPSFFCQINRFEIVNINTISFIEHADKELTLSNGYSTSISPNYYKSLCDKLGLN